MKTLDLLDLKDKRVLLRVDFNVPMDESKKISDDTRITAAKKTINEILAKDASIILVTHLGRPKGKPNNEYSLKPVYDYLKKLYGENIKFYTGPIDEEAVKESKRLEPGHIMLLENIRFMPGEETGDEALADSLAAMGDIYVNDAFGTAHRAHVSTAIVASRFAPEQRAFGRLMEKEITNARNVMENAEKPFTAILGGAKVSDKIVLIKNLIDRAQNIIVGGGMAYTFFKSEGGQVGSSLVEEDRLDVARNTLADAKGKTNLMLPEDSIIADKFADDAETAIASNYEIPDGWMGLDIGPQAREQFYETIRSSKTILWNGPMGVFEMKSFQGGTRSVADAIAEATRENGAFSLIGGGDSVAAINKFELADQVSFVSTGGGAMLEFLEGNKLPGIAAIEE